MALNSNFKEGQTRTFHLTQHCDDDVVGIFTNWIYLRSLTWHYEIAETFVIKGMNPTVAAKAWLFGDYILAPKFQNDMMLYISKSNLSISGPEIMQQIGPHTPEGCALEEFLVETFCFLALNVRCHDTKVMFSWLTERLTRQVANALVKVNLELQELRKWESHEPWIFNMLPIHEFYVHN